MTVIDDQDLLGHAVLVTSTDGMPHDEWLDARRKGIGGSDAAAICGQDPYRSAFELWLDKCATEQVDQVDSEAARWGRLLEPIVREEVATREDVEIRPVGAMVAHPDRPWQLANVDGAVIDHSGRVGVYEGKTAGYWTGSAWDDDDVPVPYLLQGMHYLAVTGHPWLLYGVLIAGQRLEVRRVDRDTELIDHLITIEAEFWERVIDRRPPAPDGSKSCTDLLGHLFDVKPGSVKTVDPGTVRGLLEQRADAKAEQKAADAQRAEAENQLKVVLGDHTEAIDADGHLLFTWREHERRDLDVEALRLAHPDIAAAFTRVSTYRTFHVPTPKARR